MLLIVTCNIPLQITEFDVYAFVVDEDRNNDNKLKMPQRLR